LGRPGTDPAPTPNAFFHSNDAVKFVYSRLRAARWVDSQFQAPAYRAGFEPPQIGFMLGGLGRG